MSFYASNPFHSDAPQELVLPMLRNPMLPQPIPGKDAAGPAYLAGLGELGRVYAQQLRSQKHPNLRGFGAGLDVIGPLVNTGMDYVWPEMEIRMNKALYPIKVAMVIGSVASLVGAAFAILNYMDRK